MVDESSALVGRATPITPSRPHLVLKTSLTAPYPEGSEVAYFGLGCFWGAERAFWTLPGVFTTAVGYQGGFTENPTYEEVCTGRTGHTEIVMVVFDPSVLSYESLLSVFFENHDPTQGMRQGNDIGTQYRSAIYTTNDSQAERAAHAKAMFAERLSAANFGPVTTEIAPAKPFYFAEDYHQQYLEANPFGYCGLAGTGVSCPVGLFSER
jgi:peptide-methionine (S)-S-oxide reductase